MQKVRLVLVRITRLQEHRARSAGLESRVMTGGESLCPESGRVVEADAELDLPVAQHIGVRRAAGAVLGEEIVEHPRAVRFREAHAMQRDVEFSGGGACVLEILGP